MARKKSSDLAKELKDKYGQVDYYVEIDGGKRRVTNPVQKAKPFVNPTNAYFDSDITTKYQLCTMADIEYWLSNIKQSEYHLTDERKFTILNTINSFIRIQAAEMDFSAKLTSLNRCHRAVYKNVEGARTNVSPITKENLIIGLIANIITIFDDPPPKLITLCQITIERLLNRSSPATSENFNFSYDTHLIYRYIREAKKRIKN